MTKGRTIWFSVWVGVVASIGYGLIHDQITIRICPEYFTVWHPHLVDTSNLTVVALAWGVVATWWMGAFLGLMIGLASTIGRLPLAPRSMILKAYAWIMGLSGLLAILVGVLTWQFVARAPSSIAGARISAMSADTQHRFVTDLAIHNTSYNVAALAAFIASIVIVLKRFR